MLEHSIYINRLITLDTNLTFDQQVWIIAFKPIITSWLSVTFVMLTTWSHDLDLLPFSFNPDSIIATLFSMSSLMFTSVDSYTYKTLHLIILCCYYHCLSMRYNFSSVFTVYFRSGIVAQ